MPPQLFWPGQAAGDVNIGKDELIAALRQRRYRTPPVERFHGMTHLGSDIK